MALLSSGTSSSTTQDLSAYMQDLSLIKEEFELYKSELNYLKAKKVKVETLARKDQLEIAREVGESEGGENN